MKHLPDGMHTVHACCISEKVKYDMKYDMKYDRMKAAKMNIRKKKKHG
jgi:hypothetical protein